MESPDVRAADNWILQRKYYQHRLSFRNHWRRICHRTNINWEGRAESMWCFRESKETRGRHIFWILIEVRKVESDDEDSDFDCYDNSNGKPVHVDVDKKITRSSQKEPTFTLLPSRLEEEETNINGETGMGNDNRNGNTRGRRSNWKLKPSEQLGSIPYFWI